MRFKIGRVYNFCKKKGIYGFKNQAEAFNMGTQGFVLAMTANQNELGIETIKFIKQTYGEKVFKRLVDTRNNPTWLNYDEEA